jgi:hypothetical protein
MPTPRPLFVLCIALLGWSACKDQQEPIPAYIRIEPFVIDAGGDAAWHKITEGWLYVNGEFLGAYTLPAEVPVLAAGVSEVLVFPGVKENGIVGTPNIYPILTRYDQDYTLTPGQIVTVQPNAVYNPDAKFPWPIERGSFDAGAASTLALENRDQDTSLNLELRSDSAFFGRSLLLQVDTAHRLMQVATELVSLPATFAKEVWLEMHYRNDLPFTLFLIGRDGTGSEVPVPVYQFNPREGFKWNKIYINLTESLITLQDYNQYRLLFQLSLQTDIQGNLPATAGKVYIDNIRLAHF